MATYYVTAGAAGGGVGSEADPFTLAEAFAGTGTGDTYWIKSGSYSVEASASISTAGLISSLNLYVGYNTATGDLDDQGRNTDGSLDTTNMPVLTLTDYITIPSYVFMLNLVITGSYEGDMLGGSSSDGFGFINCSITQAADNSATVNTIRADDQVTAINCDFFTGVGASASIIRADYHGMVYGCRFVITGTVSVAVLRIITPVAISNYFSGNGQLIFGVTNTSSAAVILIANTFYNCGVILSLPNAALGYIPYLINNHVTDSDEWIDNQYSATDNASVVEVNNRLRDITTARTGIGESVTINQIDTDTGGPETDYTDYANNDLSLIDGAAGVDAGIGIGSHNIGASQNSRVASEGGSGLTTEQATWLEAINTRVILSLPEAAPGTAEGLVQNQDLPSESDQAQTTSEYIDANATFVSNITSVKATTDRLDALIEDSDGDRFTEKALETAPSGTVSATDVNIVSVAGTEVTSVDDFKADVSLLALESTKFDPTVDEVEIGYTWKSAFRRLLSVDTGKTTNGGKSFWSICGTKIRLVYSTLTDYTRTIDSEDLTDV
jgi:hypothetical protein